VEVLSKQPSVKGPSEMFTGDVWFDVIARGEEPSRMRVNAVHFAPYARTAWHVHALGQTLYVTEGVGYRSAVATSSRSVPATSSTRLRASGTGTAPHPATS
jgi:quercetin dioxygenase-like cupin family protein